MTGGPLGPVAPAEAALSWYTAKLAYETDASDVAAALRDRTSEVAVFDARSGDAYRAGHVPGAGSLPHGDIDAAAVERLDRAATVVVYCWGPHCNGADKAAVALARHGVAAKVMIGGIWGWEQEGLPLATGESPGG